MAHGRGVADGGLRRKPLGCDGTGQADYAQQNQDAAAAQQIGYVPLGDTHVDDVRHHKGHQQIKQRLQQLEQRGQYALAPISLQKAQERMAFFPVQTNSPSVFAFPIVPHRAAVSILSAKIALPTRSIPAQKSRRPRSGRQLVQTVTRITDFPPSGCGARRVRS